MFKNEIYGYYPGEYFGCIGFIKDPRWTSGVLDREIIRFKYAPYNILKINPIRWIKENIALYEVLVKFEKEKKIRIALDSYYSKDGKILIHMNPNTEKFWLTIHELGGIQYLRTYGKLMEDYRIVKQALYNYQYSVMKKDNLVESLQDRLDKLKSELDILRPEKDGFIDALDVMRTSQFDLAKRAEYFRQKAESFEGLYKESTGMVKNFGVIATSLKNIVIAHAETMDRLYDVLAGRKIGKAEKLVAEVEKYKSKLDESLTKIDKTFTEMSKIKEKQKELESKEAEKIATRRTTTGGETPISTAE